MTKDLTEVVARAIAPKAWATEGAPPGHDPPSNRNRRVASLRHATAAIAAHKAHLSASGYVIVKRDENGFKQAARLCESLAEAVEMDDPLAGKLVSIPYRFCAGAIRGLEVEAAALPDKEG